MSRMPHLVLAVVAVLTLGPCTSASSIDRSAAPAVEDPGLEHVHGLGVNPADGALYAATHYGLFRLPERGTANRVADRYQDTMGFTVTGPNSFLGSGHPDLVADPDLPARLGLIRSADAGESWENVSLSGEADFHALHAVHDRVYGWDSGTGQFMVSVDGGLTWDIRSILDVYDFAVSPTDPDVVLATTPQGVLLSGDGGRSWQPRSAAPALAVVDWPSDGALFGVTTQGTVHHSADGGATWEIRGDVGGQPEALTVDERGGAPLVYVGVAGRGILASSDGGTSFTTRYTE